MTFTPSDYLARAETADPETAAMPPKSFPDEWSCTAWEDCQHDGVCHDPKNCGAIGPNHGVFYDLTDEEIAALTGDPT